MHIFVTKLGYNLGKALHKQTKRWYLGVCISFFNKKLDYVSRTK